MQELGNWVDTLLPVCIRRNLLAVRTISVAIGYSLTILIIPLIVKGTLMWTMDIHA